MNISYYWNTMPTSPNAAATYDDLCARWNVDRRAARRILHALSLYDDETDLVLIRSTKGGFYRTENPALIAAYRREVFNRGRNTFAALKKIDRVLNRNRYQYSVTNNIRLLRFKHCLTQSQLAEMVSKEIGYNVSQSLLSVIETGAAIPTAEMVNALASVFGVSPSEVSEEVTVWSMRN